ncbi:MAG TPA: hypothetical protein VFF73_34630 [Planctomycetota bacterium]|nr:hypothetical protein [Planctomycetota bacterium]
MRKVMALMLAVLLATPGCYASRAVGGSIESSYAKGTRFVAPEEGALAPVGQFGWLALSALECPVFVGALALDFVLAPFEVYSMCNDDGGHYTLPDGARWG